ncbi:MAG: type II toxin-antitoxin system VapC family toxin [Planctomycetota bacterium]|jgi:predicted nucleic acid-binding protein
MSAVFADTYYFLVLLNERDEAHQSAIDAPIDDGDDLITTAWVLTEVADALAAPQNRATFIELLDARESDPSVVIAAPSTDLFDRGVDLYGQRADKGWTLTDCISFAVMREMKIGRALTGDRHFEQAGFVALLA